MDPQRCNELIGWNHMIANHTPVFKLTDQCDCQDPVEDLCVETRWSSICLAHLKKENKLSFFSLGNGVPQYLSP